eukprot:5086782-Pleurochrysis_carterae.AAC.1
MTAAFQRVVAGQQLRAASLETQQATKKEVRHAAYDERRSNLRCNKQRGRRRTACMASKAFMGY